MPFVKIGPKGMRGTLTTKLTPRQRAAICWPCNKGEGLNHLRYHRRNGGWQSVLTFDLWPAPPHDDGCEAADDGMLECTCEPEPRHRAMWHAQATTWPSEPLGVWTPDQQRDVKRILKRLLKNVGYGQAEVQKGKETVVHKGKKLTVPLSIHFYREATMSEIAQCNRARRN